MSLAVIAVPGTSVTRLWKHTNDNITPVIGVIFKRRILEFPR